MPTGRFREPVSSSPVSLMGSRRPASGSVLVLPPKFSASPGWFYERARDSVLPSPPPSSVASKCLSEGQSPGCEGAPRPSSCGPSFLSGDSWRRQPLTRPPIAQLLPACAVHPKTFNHLPLSPTNIKKQKQTNTGFHSRAKHFLFTGGVPWESTVSQPPWTDNVPESGREVLPGFS